MRRLLLGFGLLTVIFLAGCASTPKVQAPASEFLFPYGQYQQEANVEVAAVKPAKTFDFNALVQRSTDEMLFVGYSGFGFTLFKIHEKVGQPLVAESTIDEIQKNKEFFIKIFRLVKTIMSVQRADPHLVAEPNSLRIHLQLEELTADVQFLELDENKIPRTILVETPGQYSVRISTKSYKLL